MLSEEQNQHRFQCTAGKLQVCSHSEKKRGRFLHRRQAEKPGFVLESKKLLPVV